MNSVKDKFLLLIKVSRLVWNVAPLFFLVGLIVSSNISGNITITPLAISQILLLTVPYSTFLYGINDIYDYEIDKINPRKGDPKGGGFLKGIKLEPEYHSYIKRVSFLVISLLFLTSFLTLNVSNILGMVLLVFFSYFYSAPPVRLKERPPLDSFSNGMLYFFAPFLLGFSFGEGSIINVGIDIWVALILLTVCVMGIHAYSTIVDYNADKEVGVKTFAIVFGKRGAALFALLAFLVTLLVVKPSPLIIPFTYYYLGFCSVLFFITLIFPSRKIAKLFWLFPVFGLGTVAWVILLTNLIH